MKSPTLSSSYLIRNQYSYCFRMRVPLDIQPILHKKELRYSLHTGYLSEAKHRARLLAGLVQKLIHHLRKHEHAMNLTEQEIDEILDAFKDTAINPYISWNTDQAETSGTPGITEMFGDLLTRIANMEMVLKSGPERESWITSKLDSLLEGMQYDLKKDIDKDSSQYRELCRNVIKATMDQLNNEKVRLQSEYQELELDRIFSKQLSALDTEERPTPSQTSDTLEMAFNDYWDEYRHKWKPRSKLDYEGVTKQILELLGPDTPIHTLSYVQLRDLRNDLRSGKLSKSGEPLSIDRVNLCMMMIRGVYELAIKKDKNLDRLNPADGLRLQDKRAPSSKHPLCQCR